MNFKENLKQLRIKNGLTQNELAKLLDISLPTLRTYEQGLYQAKYEILEQLTQIFNCSYDDLLK